MSVEDLRHGYIETPHGKVVKVDARITPAEQSAELSADRLHGLLRTERAYAWLKAGAESVTAHAEQHHPRSYEGESYAETLRRALAGAEKIERTGNEPTLGELGYGEGEADGR